MKLTIVVIIVGVIINIWLLSQAEDYDDDIQDRHK